MRPPAAAERPRGERASLRGRVFDADEPPDLSVRVAELESQLLAHREREKELRRQFALLESKRTSDRNRADDLQGDKEMLEAKIAELENAEGPERKEKLIVDQAIWNLLERSKTDRTGGMATAGSEEDPHVVRITGDGAGLTRAKSGVRVGVFLGSTEYLNQSSNDVVDLVTYTVRAGARGWSVGSGGVWRGRGPLFRRSFH